MLKQDGNLIHRILRGFYLIRRQHTLDPVTIHLLRFHVIAVVVSSISGETFVTVMGEIMVMLTSVFKLSLLVCVSAAILAAGIR